MGTRIEYFFQTPDGPLLDRRFSPTVLHNDSTFYDYCAVENQECLVEIADVDGETLVEIFKNDSEEELYLNLPQESFEFRLIDESPEPEPARIVRVTHTQETPAKESFIFSLN